MPGGRTRRMPGNIRSVHLEFSVAEYLPSIQSKAVVKCVVQKRTTRAVNAASERAG